MLDAAATSLRGDRRGLSRPRAPSPSGRLPLLCSPRPSPRDHPPAVPPCRSPPRTDLPALLRGAPPAGSPGPVPRQRPCPGAHRASAAAPSPAAPAGTPVTRGQRRSPRSRPQPACPSAAAGRRGHLPRAAGTARGERAPSRAGPSRAGPSRAGPRRGRPGESCERCGAGLQSPPSRFQRRRRDVLARTFLLASLRKGGGRGLCKRNTNSPVKAVKVRRIFTPSKNSLTAKQIRTRLKQLKKAPKIQKSDFENHMIKESKRKRRE